MKALLKQTTKDLGLKLFTAYLLANVVLLSHLLLGAMPGEYNGQQTFFLSFLIIICLACAALCAYVIYDNSRD